MYRIAPRGVVALRDELYALRHGEPRPAGPLPECNARGDGSGPEELYTCGAGRIAFFVDALGNASHCVIDREPSFPMLSTPWTELWARDGRVGHAAAARPMRHAAAAPCAGDAATARRGRDWRRGSPFSKDQYQCDITHAIHGLPPDAGNPALRARSRPAPPNVTLRGYRHDR
jgi:hypothetical protein